MSRNVLSVESLVLGEVALRDKCYKLNPISFDVRKSLILAFKTFSFFIFYVTFWTKTESAPV